MIRFLLLVVFILVAVIGIGWYSAQSLPSWYQQDGSHTDVVTKQLSDDIQHQGVGKLLGSKIGDVLRGKLSLNETEFNALLQASLQANEDGRKLLSVSDAVHAELLNGRVELGVVLNLEKVVKVDDRTREAVEKVTAALPFLDKSRLFLAVQGQPIAKNGNLAFTEDISLKIGGIPISNGLLQQLGVSTAKVATESLPIEYLSIKSVDIREGEITFGVSPKF